MKNEIKRKFIEESHFTEADYPFKIKPTFSTLSSIIESSRQEPKFSFVSDDSSLSLLGFNLSTIYEEYNPTPNPVDTLSFDKFSPECDIAQGTIFKRKRSAIIHNFNMDYDPGYKYVETFCAGLQLYMMQSKKFVSSITFMIKKRN